MIDRIVGVAIFLIAASAFVVAGGYEAGFGDPLGPAVFPRMIAAVACLLSLGLILRPGPAPVVQGRTALIHQGLTLAVLIGYVQLLEPLGFPLTTSLATGLLAALFGARAPAAAATGIGVGIGLFLIFDKVLGLPLPFAPTLFG